MPAWESELRAKFPALRLWTYLNSAGAGPLAFEVARAGGEVYESLLAGGDAEWEEQNARIEEARHALATLAGCAPEELAFTRNTSHGASLVAQMLWEQGKRTAVALEDEFPSSTLPFLHRGFDVRFVKSVAGRYRLEDVDAALAGRDLLVASHVLYRTGHAIEPAAFGRVAKAHGADFYLCATQSLGALQLDFARSGASFLTGTSHKWLCAGYGAGYLAIRQELHEKLHWPQVGWLSQEHVEEMRNDRLEIVRRPRALEMGCQPSPSLLALGAAVRLWLSTGPERVERRVRALTRSLRSKLRDAGFDAPDAPEEELSGITVVPVAEAGRVVTALAAERIASTPRGAGVRLAVHAFNDDRDLARAVEVLARVAKPV